jgi:hypothetical protein
VVVGELARGEECRVGHVRVLGRAGETSSGAAEDALDVARSLPAPSHAGKANDHHHCDDHPADDDDTLFEHRAYERPVGEHHDWWCDDGTAQQREPGVRDVDDGFRRRLGELAHLRMQRGRAQEGETDCAEHQREEGIGDERRVCG